jgi:GR25 family glycosyltransferase involved in LPS biosynthesis
MEFKYVIVGIRENAKRMEKVLRNDFTKNVKIISFDGAKEEITRDMYSPNESLKLMRRELSRGEIGCALGHLLAYKSNLESDWVIVLEDDTEILQNPSNLESVLTKFGKKPMVVHLNDIDLKSKKRIHGKYFWYNRPYRTHAYAINKKAIKIAIAYQNKIITTADWPVQWAYIVPFYWLKNDTFMLRDQGSIIEGERRPLQVVEHFDFQKFRSLNKFFSRINRTRIGHTIIGISYIVFRFTTYCKYLDIPLLSKLRTSIARSYSDLR